jgi:hypothetical protein
VARRGTLAHIDIAELEKLCAMQCTDEEIAAWFGVDRKTIEHRRKVPKFAQIMDRGKAKGKISVRRMQMKLLEDGNATMGVWLGKQLLGQTDNYYHINGSQIHIVYPLVQRPEQPTAEEFTRSIRREPQVTSTNRFV